MGKYWCKTCSTFVDEYSKKAHESSSKHQANIQRVLQKLKATDAKQKTEQKLVEKLIAEVDTKDAEEKDDKPRTNVYGYKDDGKTKYKNGKKVKKQQDKEDPKEDDTATVSKWEIVEHKSISKDKSLPSTELPTIKRRKLTVSEKEIKNWDLTEADPAIEVSDDDDEDIGSKVTFKRRKVPFDKKNKM